MTQSNGNVDLAVRFVGESPVTVWALKGTVRLARAFGLAGATDLAAWPGPPLTTTSVLLVRADYAFDGAFIAGLTAMPEAVLTDAATGAPVAIRTSAARAPAYAGFLGGASTPERDELPRIRPNDLETCHDRALRKKGPGMMARITAETRGDVERALFGAAYKDVTDLVTKYAWPWPARHVTKLCAHLRVRPNAVTALGAALVVLAGYLFAIGDFGLGLIAAWIMTFLDTVDGKLARVTITSSKFGNVFDHGIDLIHPPIWYWLWLVGLDRIGMTPPSVDLIAIVVLGGYVLQRLEELAFKVWFGMEIHIWQRFDSRFRLITARRNPNMILLTVATLLGRPDLGIVAVAVWTALSILVHAVRLGMAFIERGRNGALRSWLAL